MIIEMVGMEMDTLMILVDVLGFLINNIICDISFRSHTVVSMGSGWRPGSRKSSEICSEQREVSTHAYYVSRCHDHTMGHSRSAPIMGGIIRRSY